MVNIIVCGINGRMGKAIEDYCKKSDIYTIVAGVDVNLGIPHEFPTAGSITEIDAKADAVWRDLFCRFGCCTDRFPA